MTVGELLARARECVTCGEEHKPRRDSTRPGLAPQWSAPDGHPYSPRVRRDVIAQLEQLAA